MFYFIRHKSQIICGNVKPQKGFMQKVLNLFIPAHAQEGFQQSINQHNLKFHESQNCIFAIKYNRIQGHYAPNFRSWEGFGRYAPHVLTLCIHPHKYINFLISLPCPFHCHEDSAFQDNDIFYQVVIVLSFGLFHTPAI